MSHHSVLDNCKFLDALSDEAKAAMSKVPAIWDNFCTTAIQSALTGTMAPLKRIRIATSIEGTPSTDVDICEEKISSPESEIPVRIYFPKTKTAHTPAIFYVHGGGWCLGGISNCAQFCKQLTSQLELPVIVPEYRLTPEHPFPAANNDVAYAAQWLFESAERLGIDPKKIYFAGDSAGAQLALCTCLRRLDKQQALPSGQILFYPVATLKEFSGEPRECHQKFSQGSLLSCELFKAMIASYISQPFPQNLRELSPLETDLHKLPRSLIFTAECDILKETGTLLAHKLAASHVPVEHHEIPSVPHAFLTAPGFPQTTKSTLSYVKNFILQKTP